MNYYLTSEELYHHGILGQKWGVRRFQNKDGSYTSAGRKRYDVGNGERKDDLDFKKFEEKASSLDKEAVDKYLKDINKKSVQDRIKEITDQERNEYRNEMIKRGRNADFYKNATDKEIDDDIARKQRIKKAIIVGTAAVGIGAACYMAYKTGVFERLNSMENMPSAVTSPVGTKPDKVTDAISKLPNMKQLKEAEFAAFDDVDFVLNKDSCIHRQSAFKDFDLNKVTGPLYATHTELDTKIYRAFLKDWNETGERYDVSLKTLKDISAPSERKTRKIISKLFEDDEKFLPELAKTYTDFAYKDHMKGLSDKKKQKLYEGVQLQFESMMDKNEQFKMAMWSVVREGYARDKITDAVKKEGYNAMIDYFDKGSMSDSPLIFLDPKRDLVKTGEQFVSEMQKRMDAREVYRRKDELSESTRKHLFV